MIFLVGRNPSMAIPFGSDASRITAVTNAIQYVIDKAFPFAVNYGYAEYPSRTGCTGSNSCCVSTDGWLRPSNLTSQSERMVSCDGPPSSCLVANDGRPVAQALGRIPQWLSSATNPRYAILFADGSPGCSGENSGDACTQAIAAITSLRQPPTGIKPVVVVVALGDDASKNTCLKMMAQEGGYFDMPPPVQAGDGKTLNTVLTQIVAKAALDYCTINLTSAPDPGSTLHIKVWGIEIDRDTSTRDPSQKDGWDFNAAGSSRIQVYGEACELLQSAPRSEIRISSCPSQGSP